MNVSGSHCPHSISSLIRTNTCLGNSSEARKDASDDDLRLLYSTILVPPKHPIPKTEMKLFTYSQSASQSGAIRHFPPCLFLKLVRSRCATGGLKEEVGNFCQLRATLSIKSKTMFNKLSCL